MIDPNSWTFKWRRVECFQTTCQKKQVIETRDSYVMYRLYLDALIENYSDEYAFFPGM